MQINTANTYCIIYFKMTKYKRIKIIAALIGFKKNCQNKERIHLLHINNIFIGNKTA